MNELLDGFKELVASFDANQHAIIKKTAHTVLETYRGKIPLTMVQLLEKLADGRIDAFLDSKP